MHTHEKIVCSCGRVIRQCRCMESGKNVRTVPNGCDKCQGKVAAIVPAGQVVKPWQDVDTSGDETAYPKVGK